MRIFFIFCLIVYVFSLFFRKKISIIVIKRKLGKIIIVFINSIVVVWCMWIFDWWIMFVILFLLVLRMIKLFDKWGYKVLKLLLDIDFEEGCLSNLFWVIFNFCKVWVKLGFLFIFNI